MYYDESFEPEEIEKQHEELLRIFLEDISHLSDKTIRKNINNVAFFINDYLIYYNGANYEEVNEEIDSFFSDFFIRKCMWSTPNTTKETAASLKKFYKSMMEHGKFEKEEYKLLCDTIKEEMENWQQICNDYNNGSYSSFMF